MGLAPAGRAIPSQDWAPCSGWCGPRSATHPPVSCPPRVSGYDDRGVDKKLLQTQFSFQATSLSESFGGVLGRLRVGPHGYVPDMTAPDGPSTGGGVQDLQHVRLVPPQPSMPTLVVG